MNQSARIDSVAPTNILLYNVFKWPENLFKSFRCVFFPTTAIPLSVITKCDHNFFLVLMLGFLERVSLDRFSFTCVRIFSMQNFQFNAVCQIKMCSCRSIFICDENIRSLCGAWNLQNEKQCPIPTMEKRTNPQASMMLTFLFRSSKQNENHKPCHLLRYFYVFLLLLLWICSVFRLIDTVNVLNGWISN